MGYYNKRFGKNNSLGDELFDTAVVVGPFAWRVSKKIVRVLYSPVMRYVWGAAVVIGALTAVGSIFTGSFSPVNLIGVAIPAVPFLICCNKAKKLR